MFTITIFFGQVHRQTFAFDEEDRTMIERRELSAIQGNREMKRDVIDDYGQIGSFVGSNIQGIICQDMDRVDEATNAIARRKQERIAEKKKTQSEQAAPREPTPVFMGNIPR